MRVAVTTLGCKINQYESAAIEELLTNEGYRLVPFDSEADIYVVNTCTVTARTDAESRKLIRRAKRLNPAGKIVVTGCYAQVAPEEVAALHEVDLVIGNSEKRGIPELLLRIGEGPRTVVGDISAKPGEPLRLETHADHTRAFLQVQNGCDSYCSYCIVPHARGRSRSVPLTEALEGIRTFGKRGFLEVVLTGIHLGAYGLDLNPPADLVDLLLIAEEEVVVPRLRLGSIEPLEVTERLVSLIAGSRTVCQHLHIPLQSGDDDILSRMNRGYTREFFRERILALAAAVPGICLGIDVIVGFPGETEENFQRTVDLVEDLPLAYLHVFPFSPRPGTPAATFEGNLPPAVLNERGAVLRSISAAKTRDYRKRFVGEVLPVLVQKTEEGKVRGLSRNYIPVTADGAAPVNSEVEVLITSCAPEGCRGKIITR